MEECQEFINRVIEARHQRVWECQRSKLESLYQQKTSVCSNMGGHSNQNSNSNCAISNQQTNNTGESSKTHTWVKNLSDIPPTEAQECLLAHWPDLIHSTKEEMQAIKELKKDDNRMILTADKEWPWWCSTKKFT